MYLVPTWRCLVCKIGQLWYFKLTVGTVSHRSLISNPAELGLRTTGWRSVGLALGEPQEDVQHHILYNNLASFHPDNRLISDALFLRRRSGLGTLLRTTLPLVRTRSGDPALGDFRAVVASWASMYCVTRRERAWMFFFS